MTDEERDRFSAMVDEEQRQPLTYFKHDVLAHDDPALQELRDTWGMGAYGRYWLLVELLAGRRDHRYDVSTPNGAARLARDLETDAEGLAEFAAALDSLGLIVHDLYAEHGVVAIDRIARNARECAEYVAKRRMNGIKTAEKRWGKGR